MTHNSFGLSILLALVLSGCSGLGIDCVNGTGDPVRKTITVPTFHGIELEGSVDVVISRGTVQLVEVEGQKEMVDLITTQVDNGVWNIEASKCFSTDRPFTVHITIPELDHIAVAGSGDVQADSVFGAGETVLRIAGSGNIRASGLNEKRLIVNIQGSGDVEISGTAANFDAQVQGSGNIMAGPLSAAEVEVVIQGSGDAEFTAITSLNATVQGSGNVRYRGKPKVVSRIEGSGSVVPAE
ncbi:MAG: DUF2807 domain-containing protein [Flavobacteriales bacterium]|nr:DUF2807 domain-containing protein [Flavobacteriales bacterium]